MIPWWGISGWISSEGYYCCDQYVGFSPFPWHGVWIQSYICVWCNSNFFLSFAYFSFLFMTHHNWPIGTILSNSAQVFMLAVPGLSLFVICSFIWIVQKILVIVACMWSGIIYFSVTSWSGSIWWHWLCAVFSYMAKQVFPYLSFDLFGMGGICQNIYSAHLSPPPPPPF